MTSVHPDARLFRLLWLRWESEIQPPDCTPQREIRKVWALQLGHLSVPGFEKCPPVRLRIHKPELEQVPNRPLIEAIAVACNAGVAAAGAGCLALAIGATAITRVCCAERVGSWGGCVQQVVVALAIDPLVGGQVGCCQ